MVMSLSNQTLFSSPPTLSALSFHKTLNSPTPTALFFSFFPHRPFKRLSSTSMNIHGSPSFLARCAPHEAASADSATLVSVTVSFFMNYPLHFISGSDLVFRWLLVFSGFSMSLKDFVYLTFFFSLCILKTNEEEVITPQDDVKEADNVEGETKEEEAAESTPQNESDLKNLIASYREAVLSGDEEAASKIEAKMNDIEVNVNDELIQKVSALSAEVTSGRDRYIRLKADFDNFRKRSENERLNIRSDAQGAVIESLLPMVDSFERAKQQLKPETDKEKRIDASYQGIYKQFLEIMKGLQVTSVPTVGHPFDPSVHEAIAREESEEYEEGIVVQEFRPGFCIGDRLIRPAMVKVSEGPGPKRSMEAADTDTASPEEKQEATTEE
ncbi:Protein GrpE [Linum perenne]